MTSYRSRTLSVAMAFALAMVGCDRAPEPAPLPVEVLERGVAAMQAGDLATAGPLFEDAARQFAAAGRRDFQLQALSYSARVARDRGLFALALANAARGVDLGRQLGDVRAMMMHRLIEANVYGSVGLPSKAAGAFEEAARLGETFTEPGVQAEAEIGIASILSQRAADVDAMDRYTLALALARTAKRDDLSAQALMGVAEIFARTGKPDEAINSANQAIALVDASALPEAAARLRLRLGSIQEAARNANAALTTYREGVNLLRRARSARRLEVQLLYRIGELYASNRRSAEARKHYSDALEIARREGDGIAHAYLSLRIQDEDAAAMPGPQRERVSMGLAQAYGELADRFHAIGQYPGEAAAAGRAAEALESGGDAAASMRALRRAVGAERLSILSFADPVLHRPYLERFGPAGRQSVWSTRLGARLIAANRVLEGLTVIEQHRQSTAADALEESDLTLRHPAQGRAADTLRADWIALRLSAAEAGAEVAWGADAGRHGSPIEAALRSSGVLFARAASIAAAIPSYGPAVRSDTVRLDAIQTYLSRGTAAVEYVHDGGVLTAVTISREGARVARRAIERDALRSKVEEYLRLMQDPLVYAGSGGEASVEPMTRFAVLSTELYDLFIRPIEGSYDRGIVVVNSEVTGRLPLHALEKQERSGRVGYLIESASVDYVPSWAALLYPTRPALRMQSIVAVGNPSGRNWSTDYELRDIRSFFRLADVVIGRDATWSDLRTKRPDLLQLATTFRPGDGALGSFLAADSARPDALIDVRFERLTDMAPPPVVILSDDLSDGEGLRPEHMLVLRMNGTSDVFVNRWIADRKASKFFSEFFFTHLANGLAPGDAYRQAVLNLIHTPDVQHPRSWAQFFHFGTG